MKFTINDIDELLKSFRKLNLFHNQISQFFGDVECSQLAEITDEIMKTIEKLMCIELNIDTDFIDNSMYGWNFTDMLMETDKKRMLSAREIINDIKEEIKERGKNK